MHTVSPRQTAAGFNNVDPEYAEGAEISFESFHPRVQKLIHAFKKKKEGKR